MVSTTSGTTTFMLDVDELIDQAYTPMKKDHASGLDAQRARKALNLLLIKMQNKNIPLNKVDVVSVPLLINTPTYSLSADISDVLQCSITANSVSRNIDRRSLKEYNAMAIKTTKGPPNCFVTERLNSHVDVTFWMVPDKSSYYTADLLVAKRVEDITASYQKVDLPVRYLPLLKEWLSYELAMMTPGTDENLKNRLKQEYTETMLDTFEEDRERTDITIIPGGIRGR